MSDYDKVYLADAADLEKLVQAWELKMAREIQTKNTKGS